MLLETSAANISSIDGFEDLLLVPGMGPRTVAALALVVRDLTLAVDRAILRPAFERLLQLRQYVCRFDIAGHADHEVPGVED